MYEVSIALYGSQVKNAADVMVKTPLTFLGRNGSLVFNLIVTIIFFVAIFKIEKQHRLKFSIYIPMFFESVLYALFLGPAAGYAVGYIFQHFLAEPMSSGIHTQVLLSVGAGIYEEIVFRLILLSTLSFLFSKVFCFKNIIGIVLSIIIGSIAFSSIHYIGSLSDTFTSASFIFRFAAGMVLSTIYMFRGLGIAVYTHAIYDVLLVFQLIGR